MAPMIYREYRQYERDMQQIQDENHRLSPEIITRFSPTKPYPIITYGLPYWDLAAWHVRRSLGCRRPFVILSSALSRNPLLIREVVEAIGRGNIAALRKGVRPHAYYDDIIELCYELVLSRADCIITIGGGSAIDVAKAVVLALANFANTPAKLGLLFRSSAALRTGGPMPARGSADVKPATMEIICVTTTLSAAEFTAEGYATNHVTGRKQLFCNPSREGPKVVVADVGLTVMTPQRVWLSTGVQAVSTCIEALCSSRPHPYGDTHALVGLSYLILGLLGTRRVEKSHDDRFLAHLGALTGMKAATLYGATAGAVRGIGNQLGPWGIPHGETACILLPAVLRFNIRATSYIQGKIPESLWDEPKIAEVLTSLSLTLANELGDVMDVLIRHLDLPRQLGLFNIGYGNLDAIAKACMRDTACRTNVIPLEYENVIDILTACL